MNRNVVASEARQPPPAPATKLFADLDTFSSLVIHLPLRPYQRQPARAILHNIIYAATDDALGLGIQRLEARLDLQDGHMAGCPRTWASLQPNPT